MTTAQVAEMCQLSTKTVRRAIQAGDLGAFKLGACLRISRQAVATWLEARRTRPQRRPSPDNLATLSERRDRRDDRPGSRGRLLAIEQEASTA